jgi:hypothetical protein
LADQAFHIICLSIEASWIEFCDLRGASDGQEGVGSDGVGAVGGAGGGVRVVAAGEVLFAVGDL